MTSEKEKDRIQAQLAEALRKDDERRERERKAKEGK